MFIIIKSLKKVYKKKGERKDYIYRKQKNLYNYF